MSRIGKQPVSIPEKVDVKLDGHTILVKGPKGELSRELSQEVEVTIEDGEIIIARPDDGRTARSFQGLVRSLVANMVEGVSVGYKRSLEINGVGYRAEQRGQFIRFDLGYSHPIMFELPASVSATIERQTQLTLESVDKELLGQVAAKIRGLRKPEPYKGKGIKYSDEVIRRKAGKSGA
ncbi:50S ribosomal protein L6 [Bradymonadaceae bacterium TMQ3]|uniref:Large ribosomal subunit protein uL6 n=1 Tax=Lujinxingia sediminis TaxID=2480984 RepID=A0ABY0CP85_9DELT|nr:50S ribosomal protein L6 [Lujinxingia sediminis]RDV38067.1 50S ribosomal protein L6 [Bradymonadaceae bacterium TMQ3]RVU42264.1 50S ribosomal protein L6 [Lujinxingia sediminis]TXC75737.1 50S ribosomal protein L6 [Bradymonadales bacterium TMQ1]